MAYTKADVDMVIEHYGFEYKDVGGYYQMRTYCHNPEGDGSHKLYIYFNDDDVNFQCYTNCDHMDLVQFIMHYREENYYDAKDELDSIIGASRMIGFEVKKAFNPASRLKKKKQEIEEIKKLNKAILNHYYNYQYGSWISEGISMRTQNKFGIRYSIEENKIIIPQLDKDGNLIGVRGRALNSFEVDRYGKYRPVVYNHESLKYPTGQNLYGLYYNKEEIVKTQQVVVFESEKSVMQMDTFQNGHGNGVALSGSFISEWQLDELSKLGVNEIVIGLDKDYNSKSGQRTRATIITKMFRKLVTRFNVTYHV